MLIRDLWRCPYCGTALVLPSVAASLKARQGSWGATSVSEQRRSPVAASLHRVPLPDEDPQALLRALTSSVEEEADVLRKLVADEDSNCIVRDLRAERLAAMEWVLRLFRQVERWEW